MEGVERYVERFAIEEHTHLSKLKQKTKNNYIKIMTCGRKLAFLLKGRQYSKSSCVEATVFCCEIER